MGADKERLSRARAALARAEEQAGVRSSAQRSVESAGRALLASAGAPGRVRVRGRGLPVDEGDPGRAGAVRSPSAGRIEDPLPGAAGHVLEVPDRTGDLVRAVASVLPPGGWTGFVAVPDIGWDAARRAGIDLERVINVPRPGPLAADVVAILVEGADVLCLGSVELSPAQRRRLAARLRRDGRVVVTARPWPGISRPWAPRDARHLQVV